ncbi:hypothetical protein [Streptomyces brasiliensis]|uniref:Uncharacterized protein n=1 Tax=Streptomyces brasiliensis TaxID=1954 RepID=A0A917K198_9ACTN|nr:hypothetical protein [Streptomyces brasiliensis]GGI94712.1 hypothetical protein GCM10010121_001370 [Streptomyces brasiliensis]
MSQPVLALGAAAVTVAGGVWYLPALADLRAGADRPLSRRTAAAACLSGWGTAGVVAVLLLVTGPWWIPVATAAAGAVLAAGLRIGATVQHRREVRETARHWAELRRGSSQAGTGRTRNVVAVLVGAGLFTAVATAILKLAAGPGDGEDWLAAAAAPALIVAVFVTLALTHSRAVRRRAGWNSPRPPR